MKTVIIALSLMISMTSFAGQVEKKPVRKVASEAEQIKSAEKIVRSLFGRSSKETVHSTVQPDGSIEVTIGKQAAAAYSVKFNKFKLLADEAEEELVDMKIVYLGGS